LFQADKFRNIDLYVSTGIVFNVGGAEDVKESEIRVILLDTTDQN